MKNTSIMCSITMYYVLYVKYPESTWPVVLCNNTAFYFAYYTIFKLKYFTKRPYFLYTLGRNCVTIMLIRPLKVLSRLSARNWYLNDLFCLSTPLLVFTFTLKRSFLYAHTQRYTVKKYACFKQCTFLKMIRFKVISLLQTRFFSNNDRTIRVAFIIFRVWCSDRMNLCLTTLSGY